MSENNSVALTTDIKAIFEKDDVKNRFNEILGRKASGFITSVINVVANDKNLIKAEKNSILFAAATAAALDLPINPNFGFAYIIAYDSNQKTIDENGREVWTKETKAQFQIGYKGFIQLAQRSGQFENLGATPVYEGDTDETVMSRLSSIITPKAGDKVIGYAAYFKLLNGFNKTLYMTSEDMRKHAKKYSQSFKSTKKYIQESSKWTTDFETMALKTVIKLLLSKFAPLSIEMQRAVLSDQAMIGDWEGNTLQYPDNTPPNPDQVSKEKEIERLKEWINKADTKEKLSEATKPVYDAGDNELELLYEAKAKELGIDINN